MACGPRTTMMEAEVALYDTYWAPAVSSRTSSSLAVTGVPGRDMHWLSEPGCDRSRDEPDHKGLKRRKGSLYGDLSAQKDTCCHEHDIVSAMGVFLRGSGLTLVAARIQNKVSAQPSFESHHRCTWARAKNPPFHHRLPTRFKVTAPALVVGSRKSAPH